MTVKQCFGTDGDARCRSRCTFLRRLRGDALVGEVDRAERAGVRPQVKRPTHPNGHERGPARERRRRAAVAARPYSGISIRSSPSCRGTARAQPVFRFRFTDQRPAAVPMAARFSLRNRDAFARIQSCPRRPLLRSRRSRGSRSRRSWRPAAVRARLSTFGSVSTANILEAIARPEPQQ